MVVKGHLNRKEGKKDSPDLYFKIKVSCNKEQFHEQANAIN